MDHDCQELCQTADLLTQILGNLSGLLENFLIDLVGGLVDQYVTPLFSQIGNLIPLPLETSFNLGTALGNLGTPFADLYLGVDIAASGIEALPTMPASSAGISLDFGLTTDTASCMMPLGTAPALPQDAPKPEFSGYLVKEDIDGQTARPYELAIALSERNIQQALWAFLNGGIACMSISSESLSELAGGFALTSGLLSLFIPELSVLGAGNSPLYLEIAPKAWPEITLGNMAAGEHLLNLSIPAITISIYMLTADRPLRLVELSLEIGAGLSILRTADTLTIAIDKIDFVTIEETYNQLFPNSNIAELLPEILDSLGGQFLNGITIPLDIENMLNGLIAPIGLQMGIEEIRTEPGTKIPGQGNWLTLYATASAVENSSAESSHVEDAGTEEAGAGKASLKRAAYLSSKAVAGDIINVTTPKAGKALAYRLGKQPWHILRSKKAQNSWQLPLTVTSFPGTYQVELMLYDEAPGAILPKPVANYELKAEIVPRQLATQDAPDVIATASQDNAAKEDSGCNAGGGTPALWFLLLLAAASLCRKLKKRGIYSLFALLALAAASCSSKLPATSEPADEAINMPTIGGYCAATAKLSPPIIKAGESTTVTCALTGEKTPANVKWQVMLDEAAQECADGTCQLSPNKSGDYTVTCKASGCDAGKARLTVTPGAAKTLKVKAAQNNITAGDYTTLECLAYDAFDNEISINGADVSFIFPDAIIADMDKITALKAGDYILKCSYNGLESAGETLTVSTGKPAIIETIATPDSFRASIESSELSCLVKDSAGNVLSGNECQFVFMPLNPAQLASISFTGNMLTAETAGEIMIFAYIPGGIADNSPAVVSVLPGLPVKLTCAFNEVNCAPAGRPLNIGCKTYDEVGNITPWPLNYEVIKQDNPIDGDTDYLSFSADNLPVFLRDGLYTVTVTPLDPEGTLDAGSDLEYSLNVIVDQTAPIITTNPGSGSVVTRGNDSIYNMGITATISEPLSGPATLIFDGSSITADAGEKKNLSKTQQSRFGLNLISASAEDACGNKHSQTRAYLRAGKYYPKATEALPEAHINNGLGLVLSQEMLDDGNRGVITNGKCTDEECYDDIASMIENMIGSQLGPMINTALDAMGDPNDRSGCDSSPDSNWPTTGWLKPRGPCAKKSCTFSSGSYSPSSGDNGFGIRKSGNIYIESLKISQVSIIDGGIRLKAYIGKNDSTDSLRVPLKIYYDNTSCVLGFATNTHWGIGGSVIMDSLDFSTDLNITIVNNKPKVTITKTNIEFDNLNVSIDPSSDSVISGILATIGSGITNLLVSIFEGLIEDLIGGVINDQIPPLLEDFLAGFVIGTSFELPPPFSVSLALDSYMSDISFKAGSKPYGIIGMATQFYPSNAGITSSTGVPGHMATPPAETGLDSGMAIRLSDDFINQILWAVWYAGVLNMDLGDLVAASGINGLGLNMKAELPPVIMPGSKSGEIELGLGNLLINANLDIGALAGQAGLPPLKVKLYAHVFLPGSLAVNDGAFGFKLSETSPARIITDVLEVNGDTANLEQFSALLNRVLSQILPNLLSSVLTNIPLPAIDLSAMGLTGIPAGTNLTIELEDLTRPGEISTRISGGISISTNNE